MRRPQQGQSHCVLDCARRASGLGCVKAALAGVLSLCLAGAVGVRLAQTEASGQPASENLALRMAYPDPSQGLFDPATPLRALRGRVVALLFVDSNCRECTQSASRIQESLGARASFVQVLASASSREGRRLGSGESNGPLLGGTAVAVDPNGELANALGIDQLPSLVLINRAGEPVLREAGLVSSAAIEVAQRLVEEPPPSGTPVPRPLSLPLRALGDSAHRPPTGVPPRVQAWLDREGSCRAVPSTATRVARLRGGPSLAVARAYDGSVAIVTYDSTGVGVGCGVGRFRAQRIAQRRKAHATGVVGFSASEGRDRWWYALVTLEGWSQLRVGQKQFPIRRNGVILGGIGRAPRTAVLVGERGTRLIRLPFGALR